MRAVALGGAACAATALMAYAVRGRSSSLLAPSVYRGPRSRRAIALTFDDGPSESTPRLLDLLGDVPATFFVCGRNVERRPEIVRMGSTLRFTTDAGEDRTVTLVFPAEADIAEGRISVLTPIGIALVGLAAGQSMDWTARDGRVHRLTVESVDGAPSVPPDAPQTELRAAS